MFEPRRRFRVERLAGVGLALALCAAVPARASAQTVEYYRAEVSRLTLMRDAARVAAARADSVTLAALPRLEVREGGFLIRTVPEMEGLAREAASIAAPALQRMFGDLYAELAAEPILLRYKPAHDTATSSGRAEDFPFEALRRKTERVSSPRAVQLTTLGNDGRPAGPWMNEAKDAERIARRLTSRVADRYFERLADDVHAWLGYALSVSDTVGGRTVTYNDLVTSPSYSARACFARDLRRCREALELEPLDDPLESWYAPDERPALVNRARYQLNQGALVAAYDQCVDRRVLAVCDRLLRTAHANLNTGAPAFPPSAPIAMTRVTTPGSIIPPPLGNVPRHTMAQLALSMGGASAARRLLEAPAGSSIGERLASVAGVPADSLVSIWHVRILAARPEPVTLTPRVAWAALLWGVFASAFALRSSRWR